LIAERQPALFAVVSASLVACAAPVPRVHPPTVAGTLRYSGGWTHIGPRGVADEWLVYSFEARAGDRVTAYVRSSAGSPAARIVDDSRRRLADSVIDHPDGDTIADATATAARTGTYYLYLGDAADPRATFEVQMGGDFACQRDAECERAGEATGDPKAPSPLDTVPVCLFAGGEAEGSCKGMTRETVERARACGGEHGSPCANGFSCSALLGRCVARP
jgi:hypothetical protein